MRADQRCAGCFVLLGEGMPPGEGWVGEQVRDVRAEGLGHFLQPLDGDGISGVGVEQLGGYSHFLREGDAGGKIHRLL